jgi:putative phosphoesterase
MLKKLVCRPKSGLPTHHIRDEKSLKLLVMSDSHKNIDRMQQAAEQTQPDAILHLGDHIGDARELQRRLPGMAIHMVPGNCDYYATGDDELLLTLGGVKIFMAHGHVFGVKNGLDALIKQAQRQKADIALFGHTHQALMQQHNGMWLMNPGQMEQNNKIRAASYGIVTIKDGEIECWVSFMAL